LPSPAGIVRILPEKHYSRRGQHQSVRITTFLGGDNTNRRGEALSPLGTTEIGTDWNFPLLRAWLTGKIILLCDRNGLVHHAIFNHTSHLCRRDFFYQAQISSLLVRCPAILSFIIQYAERSPFHFIIRRITFDGQSQLILPSGSPSAKQSVYTSFTGFPSPGCSTNRLPVSTLSPISNPL